MTKNVIRKRWNLLDAFLILFVVLAGFTLYFTFIKPIQFSKLIEREAVNQYAEVEILLFDDLAWMKEVLPAGEKNKNLFGTIDWEILAVEDVVINEKKWVKVRAKVLSIKETSGLAHYGKYTLVTGGPIYLINDNYSLQGRIFHYRLLDEKVSI